MSGDSKQFGEYFLGVKKFKIALNQGDRVLGAQKGKKKTATKMEKNGTGFSVLISQMSVFHDSTKKS